MLFNNLNFHFFSLFISLLTCLIVSLRVEIQQQQQQIIEKYQRLNEPVSFLISSRYKRKLKFKKEKKRKSQLQSNFGKIQIPAIFTP